MFKLPSLRIYDGVHLGRLWDSVKSLNNSVSKFSNRNFLAVALSDKTDSTVSFGKFQ